MVLWPSKKALAVKLEGQGGKVALIKIGNIQ